MSILERPEPTPDVPVTGPAESLPRADVRPVARAAGGRLRSRRSPVDIAGIDVDRFNEAEVVRYVTTALREGRGGRIVTPNADILSAALHSEDVRQLVARADLIVPDGVPLLWLARLTRRARLSRVTGADLIYSLSEAAAAAGASVYVLGGPEGAAETAAQALQQRYAGLVVAGTSCPPIGFDSDWNRWVEVITEVASARPDIVFCGLGFPKQERLAEALRPLLPATWFVGCGAAVSFASGDVPRAPRWMQDRGLEWLYRLAREPRRLFRRYIMRNLPFMVRLLVAESLGYLTTNRAGRGSGWSGRRTK